MNKLKSLIVLFAVIIFFTGCGKKGDNAMFRANLENTGVYETKGVPEFHQVKWKYESGNETRSINK